jgi:hypothetical protein
MAALPMARLDLGQDRDQDREEEKEEETEREREKERAEREKGRRAGPQAALAKAQPTAAARPPLGELAATRAPRTSATAASVEGPRFEAGALAPRVRGLRAQGMMCTCACIVI